jgi:hypothetical protein
MFGPRRPQKTYAYYRRTDPAGSDVDGGGAVAPSASTPPSAKSDRASDGDTVGGSLLRRTTSAPRPGHRRQGLLQEPGPSRRLGRSPRSLSQLSPEDTSPARGLGNSIPALVPPVDDPARPTRHVTGAPVTTCKKLHRHLRQYRAFSTAEPVPRLEATLRMAQQCQPSTSDTGQLAAEEGATVDMAKSGPAVMAVVGGRKQQSNRLQAHVPSWDSERALSHGVKTTRPCSVPRTARARTTATPPTTRPVALTLRQAGGTFGRRSGRRFTSAIMTASKKRCATSLNFVSFSSSPFSLLLQGPGKGILRKGSFSAKEAGPEPPY